MTDLQIGLAVIGALAVAGVLAYNHWQERAARREAQRTFSSAHPDVLLDERREPAVEPRRAAPAPSAGSAPARNVDYVMDLHPASPPSRALVQEGWTPIERRFGRRVLLLTEEIRLQAGIQLVSRDGVLSDAELLEFRSMVETLAAQLGATVRAPEMRAALDAARELDRACADADIQVALHVVGIGDAPAAFPDARFQASPREGGVTLTLDLARTLEPERTYEAMARAGRELARSRGGRMIDDEGRELDERALAAIGRELESVSRRLAGHGIEAGSPLALRVFS